VQTSVRSSTTLTNAEGWVESWPPEGQLQRLEIENGVQSTLRVLDTPTALDQLAAGTLVMDDLVPLLVRTIDQRGNRRQGERFLYRAAPRDGRVSSSYFGETTDDRGEAEIGPFRLGASVELRPGPRGEDLSSEATWRAVVVDRRPFDLVVRDALRLRLRIDGAAKDEYVRVVLLDPAREFVEVYSGSFRQGEVWDVPALAIDTVEVVAGPTPVGRFVRLRDVVPRAEPIHVIVSPVAPLTGRVAGAGLRLPVTGSVVARGRGFQVTLPLGTEGSFQAPGLPDEPITFLAQVVGSDGAAYLGSVGRTEGRDVAILVRPSVRLAGRVEFVDVQGATHPMARVLVRPESNSFAPLDAVKTDESGRFQLVVPAGPWRLFTSVRTQDRTLDGLLDLGDVNSDRNDILIRLEHAQRKPGMAASPAPIGNR
jgi:hypothetical protein